MTMTDPISDMFTRIRNGKLIEKNVVSVPFSKEKEAIAKVLHEEGYLEGYKVVAEENKKNIVIALRYYQGKPAIDKLRRVSRPGHRVYKSKENLPRSMGGLGVVIVSTSKGIMSDRQAREVGEGGEIIGTVC